MQKLKNLIDQYNVEFSAVGDVVTVDFGFDQFTARYCYDTEHGNFWEVRGESYIGEAFCPFFDWENPTHEDEIDAANQFIQWFVDQGLV